MIDQTVTIPHSSAKEIYEILINSKKHSNLTGDKAEIDPKVGGHFSAFSGYATGRITKLIPHTLIEQTWRAHDWPKDIYSKIRFELTDVKDGSQIHFTQNGLPEGTKAEFESGWQDNYWTPLIKFFK